VHSVINLLHSVYILLFVNADQLLSNFFSYILVAVVLARDRLVHSQTNNFVLKAPLPALDHFVLPPLILNLFYFVLVYLLKLLFIFLAEKAFLLS
jgi:hypothetical protein